MDETSASLSLSEHVRTGTDRFRSDVMAGLGKAKKTLDSKYFYDERGDALFQQIMDMPEYYLTGCELEIFEGKAAEIVRSMDVFGAPFDLIELGAGDATKSMVLMNYLIGRQAVFRYKPIDISASILRVLRGRLAEKFPELEVAELHGEYFDMLDSVAKQSTRKKVILFLGSNIGNMEHHETIAFCHALRMNLRPGDVVLIGFDLRKDPAIILDAYNDPAGITAAFNLNLLERINRELNANFDRGQFQHYPTYDPGTGACRSYLISSVDQQVRIGDRTVSFRAHEAVHMEISQKFAPEEIHRLAMISGFSPIAQVSDDKEWFTDAIWKVV